MTTFAAIDVGSNELSLKIFQISKTQGIREIEHIRHTMELGLETYTNGKISYPLVNELCTVLQGFTFKMKEYRITDYTAYATSALREASNEMVILDQIKLRCGLKVKILDNSEQRFLFYKAIALKEDAFHEAIKNGTAIVDVGSGSMQISIFNKETLVSTQNIRVGALRTKAILGDLESQTDNFKKLISEYIDNDIKTYSNIFLKDTNIKNIIAVGDQVNTLLHYQKDGSKKEYFNSKEFEDVYHFWSSKSLDSISKELNISKEQTYTLFPTAMIYHKIFQKMNADTMWVPHTTLCDGIAVEYAEKKEKLHLKHDFSEDIISAARIISRRYCSNTAHTQNVEYIALSIFDRIRKYHGLGKRERLLLQIAVILHDIGAYINLNDIIENSYKIIMSTEIIGLSHQECEIIANTVRYNANYYFDLECFHSLNQNNYITITKLSAILRIANAMDKSHKQKFSNIRITLNKNELIITTNTLEDITLERGLLEEKADLFEEVYGIRPILKQKRSTRQTE